MHTFLNRFFCIILSVLFCTCATAQTLSSALIPQYVVEDMPLYESIVAMDKQFFAAYNQCDMDTQAAMYAEDIEFFHDKGGLMTSKSDLLAATKRNICGKVTRELIAGSVEVYPIANYGAVQIGFHKFHNNQEPDAPSVPSKFIMMWHNVDGHWQITKVISLH
ncbi:nuclear transport factor 2 family protein [Paraglaciecola sp.]|uniref:nuclear transport factor 2 family protein n=1 Tax=Paraglaciecola sp. TaxID=1920173 RepID=UPI0030F48530